MEVRDNHVQQLTKECARMRALILDLERQLDDANAVISAQSEVLVRLQHRDQKHATR